MAASIQHDFPVKTRQIVKEVNGNQTEVLCSKFEDRWLIVVSQLNKFGTIVQVSYDTIRDELHQPSSMCSIRVLLGCDEPITHVLARNLLSEIKPCKPILLTMSLKDTQPSTVKVIASQVKAVVMGEDG